MSRYSKAANVAPRSEARPCSTFRKFPTLTSGRTPVGGLSCALPLPCEPANACRNGYDWASVWDMIKVTS